jgi:FkbM family methyltransferase
MSRFANLRQHLSLAEALQVYLRLKAKNRRNMRVSRLAHPFTLRNNPYDYGTFEEVVVKEAYGIPLSFTPQYILDGGGNIGLTAAYFATRYPSAQIVSVEPDTENYALLCRNTAPYGNIRPFQGGLWTNNAHLLVKDLGLGNNGFMVEETGADTPGAIRAWGLAALLDELQWPRFDVLKLDVEGSEKEIFSSGFEDWLPRTRVLIVELHDRMKQGCSKSVFSALSRYSFSLTIAGENLVFVNEDLSS